MTSWNIAHGMADTWDQVEYIMNLPYFDSYGNEYTVNLGAVDSGDQTDEVYDFCVYNQDWAVPAKGSSKSMLSRYKISTIDKTDSKAYGMRLYIYDGGQYKDMIAGRLQRPNGPGSWMVYHDCDREYAEQMCSEEKVLEKKGATEVEVWKPKTVHANNHYLDCEVLAALAADLLHVRYLQLSDSEKTLESPARQEKSQDSFIKQNGSWIKNEGRWL